MDVQIPELRQKIPDLFLCQPQAVDQLGVSQGRFQVSLLRIKFIHALFGGLVENACLQCPE